MTIAVDYDDFGGAHVGLNGHRDVLALGAVDLALAAMTVGRPRTAPTPARRLAQMLAVAIDVLANVAGGTAADVRCTNEYWDLDPTERGAATYRLGMGAAKLIAEEKFDVVELVHLTLLAASPAAPAITGGGSRRRADLAAEDADGNWLLLEAKGRCNTSAVGNALVGAKEQARIVRLHGAGGEIPMHLRLASVVDLETEPLLVSVRDPEELFDAKELVYEADPQALRNTYYAPLDDIRAAIDQRPLASFEADGVQAITLRDGVAIGAEIERLVAGSADEFARREHAGRRTVEWEEMYGRVGADGFALFVDRARLPGAE